MDRREAIRQMALHTRGAFSMSTVGAVLGGCEVRPDEAREFAVLVDDLGEFVAAVAERIIPETDTPGARAANVHHFIDRTAAEWMVQVEREHFLDQLRAFRDEVQAAYGRAFVELEESEQVALLREAQEAASEVEDTDLEVELATAWTGPEIVAVPGTGQREQMEVRLRPWFHTMKELTLVGYYTSEIGATQELQYEHVPGRWVPCAPLDEIGRTWA